MTQEDILGAHDILGPNIGALKGNPRTRKLVSISRHRIPTEIMERYWQLPE